MTANVRYSNPSDGINAWPNRRQLLVKTFLKYQPDIIGCQEVTPAQGAYLVKELANWYSYYPRSGVGTIDTPANAGQLTGAVNDAFESLNTLFYRSDRYDIIDGQSGLVIPTELQNIPAENTFFTLGVLKEKRSNGKTLIVIDTHIRHQEAFAMRCCLAIREIAAGFKQKYPTADVIILTDLNHDRNSPIYTTLASGNSSDTLGPLSDTFDYNAPNVTGTYHAFTGNPQESQPSDLIFLSSTRLHATQTEILHDHADNVYPSDHFLILTTLTDIPEAK